MHALLTSFPPPCTHPLSQPPFPILFFLLRTPSSSSLSSSRWYAPIIFSPLSLSLPSQPQQPLLEQTLVQCRATRARVRSAAASVLRTPNVRVRVSVRADPQENVRGENCWFVSCIDEHVCRLSVRMHGGQVLS